MACTGWQLLVYAYRLSQTVMSICVTVRSGIFSSYRNEPECTSASVTIFHAITCFCMLKILSRQLEHISAKKGQKANGSRGARDQTAYADVRVLLGCS